MMAVTKVTLICILFSAYNVAGTDTAPGRCQMDGPQQGAVAMDCDGDDETDLSLMQFMGAGKIEQKEIAEHAFAAKQKAKSRADALDSQYKLLQDLMKQHQKGEALPSEIGPMLTSIWQDARNVQTELDAENVLWREEVGKKKDRFTTCDNDLDGKLPTLQEELGKPVQSTFGIFCSSAKIYAEQLIDKDGCDNVLACAKTDMDAKKQLLDDFMSEGHCETCNNNDFEGASGESREEQMTAWLADKQGTCANHWDQKLTNFEGLYDAWTAAKKLHDDTEAACTGLGTAIGTNAPGVYGLQCSVTSGQCNYIAKVNEACAVRDQCYTDATTAWTDLKTIQATDSEDRVNGFMAAQKIKCILKVFTIGGKMVKEARHDNPVTGAVEIDATKADDCLTRLASCVPAAGDWTYEECNKLNMTTILDWTPPEPEACPTPSPFCEGSPRAWSPECDTWDGDGGHSPQYTHETLTPGQCEAQKLGEKVPRDTTLASNYKKTCTTCDYYTKH